MEEFDEGLWLSSSSLATFDLLTLHGVPYTVIQESDSIWASFPHGIPHGTKHEHSVFFSDPNCYGNSLYKNIITPPPPKPATSDNDDSDEDEDDEDKEVNVVEVYSYSHLLSGYMTIETRKKFTYMWWLNDEVVDIFSSWLVQNDCLSTTDFVVLPPKITRHAKFIASTMLASDEVGRPWRHGEEDKMKSSCTTIN